MRIQLDLDIDLFIEENNDQRERLLALLRDSIESTIRTNFKADSLNGLELDIIDENDYPCIRCGSYHIHTKTKGCVELH
jgi:hypothetical protein